MREMVNAFKKLGHEVELCIYGGTESSSSNGSNPVKNNPLKSFVRSFVPQIIWSTLKDKRLVRQDHEASKMLESKIKSFNPDLIYERGYYLMKSGCDLAEKYSIPHIIEINAPLEYEKKLFEGPTMLTSQAFEVERKLISQPGLVCVVSSAIKKHFLERHPETDEKKILVTPNAINQQGIVLNIDMSIRKQLEDKTVVGFVGSIFPYHGVDKLIKAFSKVDPKNNQLALLIVGDGEIVDELKEYSKELGIGDSVVFTGKVPHSEVYAYINLMDITVLANTEWYCSPVKLFDYGALGKAIIAINKTGVTDVMINNADGLIIENNDDQLVEALNKLVSDKDLREKIGSTFQSKVLSNHTWKATAEKVLNTFATIAK